MGYINKTYLSTQFTNFANRISNVFLKQSNVVSKGSENQPVYFNENGVATSITYTINKSVPSDAQFTDTTYSDATTSTAGLMSTEDKAKLDGIATGANKYTLPNASHITLGGVRVGLDSTSSYGIGTGIQFLDIGGREGATRPYTIGLEPATRNTIGGIIVGNNLSVDATGRLSATNTTYSDATQSTHGLMSIDDKKKLDGFSSSSDYALKTDIQTLTWIDL